MISKPKEVEKKRKKLAKDLSFPNPFGQGHGTLKVLVSIRRGGDTTCPGTKLASVTVTAVRHRFLTHHLHLRQIRQDPKSHSAQLGAGQEHRAHRVPAKRRGWEHHIWGRSGMISAPSAHIQPSTEGNSPKTHTDEQISFISAQSAALWQEGHHSPQRNHIYFTSQRLVSLGALHVATDIGPGLGPPTRTSATSANHGHPVHPFTDTFLLSPSFQSLKHGYRFTPFLWLREAQLDYSK